MAGGFPVGAMHSPIKDAYTPSSSAGVTVTSSASASVKGSYSQIIAATSVDASWLYITIRMTNSTTCYGLMDIAVGGAGSEIDVIPNILLNWANAAGQMQHSIVIPVSIPAGSRIAARWQNAFAGAATISCAVEAINDAMGSFNAPPMYSALNANTATSHVTNVVDPGTSANNKGVYAQISASTPFAYSGFFIGVISGYTTTTSGTLPQACMDLAIGAAGSEQIIVPNMFVGSQTISSALISWRPMWIGPFYIPIPAGVRLAMRASCNITTVNARLLAPVVYGMRR